MQKEELTILYKTLIIVSALLSIMASVMLIITLPIYLLCVIAYLAHANEEPYKKRIRWAFIPIGIALITLPIISILLTLLQQITKI